MRKKKPKQRTQNKFENAVISSIRVAFARYSPKYQEVMLSRRYELDKFNKDGSLSKQRDVYYKCDICGGGSKKPEIDHIDPVIEIGKSRKDYTLDEIVKRIDCDIENLQLLCEACHKEKTSNERKVRKK